MNIELQLDLLTEQEAELKNEMKRIKEHKKQLQAQFQKEQQVKKEQKRIQDAKLYVPYVERFAAIGFNFKYNNGIISIESINDKYSLSYLWESEKLVNVQTVDKLLEQLTFARQLERETPFVIRAVGDDIEMEHKGVYYLHLEPSDGFYVGSIEYTTTDVDGIYHRDFTPQLSMHLSSSGYDGFYVQWRYKIQATKQNIPNAIMNALMTLQKHCD